MPDVMGMVARALARTGDKDWAAAAELWAKVTTANPVNGDYWARLGEARFGAQDYAGARTAYEKVLRLGVRRTFLSEDAPPLMPGEVAYRIACCEAAAGDREAAVTALGVALDRGMRDLARVRSEEYWQELRDDKRIRDMAGIIDADSMSRDDGWRYDLAFLAREIKRRLVIDMRWNGGGNTLLTQHLLHHLIASKRLSRAARCSSSSDG